MISSYQCMWKSPLGYLHIKASVIGITQLYFSDELIYEHANAPILQTIAELDAYFKGTLKQFKVPLHLSGTPFQQSVWNVLRSVPYAETWSYKTLAQEMQQEKAIRAIAAANGKNPIALLIPCHRIIGSNHKMVGYAWGVERKRWLLDFEKQHAGKGQQSLFL